VSAPLSNGIPVLFTPTASGGCSTPTVISTPPSGSTFPVGTNIVNVTAFDTCGHTNTASFPVIVVLEPQLIFTNPANITVTTTDTNGLIVNFTATASSGCGSANVVSTPPSGSLFPVGITTVTNVASDGCGHSTNATFTITVNLLTPPLVLTNPANITVTAPDANGAVVTYDVTASGGCSTPTIDSTMPSGSLFPVGITIVTNTASDTCGNTTNGTFTVTVNLDTTPLSLTCPADITVTAPDANGAIVTFDVTASGGCTTPTIDSTMPSGSLFPVGTTIVTNTASDTCGNSTNATFNVTVNPPLPPVAVGAPVVSVGNQIQLTVEGAAGQNFVIEMSTNLTDWTSLITNTLVAPSTNWMDPDGISDAFRFYRVLTLP